MTKRRARTIFAIVLLLLGSSRVPAATDPATRALEVLIELLDSDDAIAQVRAAEVLIRFGHAPRAHARLVRAGPDVDAVPIQRVLRWRALAASSASEDERNIYVGRLLELVANPDAPDRLHAIESAAKLSVVAPAAQISDLQTLAARAPERDAVFVRWLLWPSHPPSDSDAVLIGWLRSTDPVTRLRAAHLLRWMTPVSRSVLEELSRAARATIEPDIAAAIIVGAAALLGASPADDVRWRERLEAMVHGADPAAAYHALQGLMALYAIEDLPILLPLLDHPAAEVRAGAAWAILTVVKRHRSPAVSYTPPLHQLVQDGALRISAVPKFNQSPSGFFIPMPFHPFFIFSCTRC
jgi:hypothetical protein